MIGRLQGENGELNIKYLKKKNLKVSVANIWKHSGEFCRRTKWLRNFADVQDDVQDDCDWLPMTLNSSFQL